MLHTQMVKSNIKALVNFVVEWSKFIIIFVIGWAFVLFIAWAVLGGGFGDNGPGFNY